MLIRRDIKLAHTNSLKEIELKLIPRDLINSSLPNLNTDKLYDLLRKEMCGSSCSFTEDGAGIGCHECILSNDDTTASKEFRELATELGISINIIRGD